jgi:transcriptional/translational regulatory protein YebC/TACO1
VSWIFEKKGYIAIPKDNVDEDALMEIALEAGADDVSEDPEEQVFEVTTSPAAFNGVREALEAKDVAYQSAEITMLPKNTVRLEGKEAQQMLRLMEAMEEADDVQNVYANFDIPKKVMESLADL